MVHGVLLARLPRAEVDDLVQDVFVTAMAAGRIAARGGRLPGLAGLDRAEPRDRFPAPAARGDRRSWCDEPAAPDGDTSEALAILAEIAALPEAYRETLVLRLVEGLTGAGDRGADGIDAGIGAREPASRDEDAQGAPGKEETPR